MLLFIWIAVYLFLILLMLLSTELPLAIFFVSINGLLR